jgi:hypothetical protein
VLIPLDSEELVVSVGLVSPHKRPVAFAGSGTSALRDVGERNRRRKKRSASATRSVIKISRESSERFVF